MGRLYVKIRTQMPIIAMTLAHQVSQHLTASAVIVYPPQSHSRCKDGDVDSELFIFASLQKPVEGEDLSKMCAAEDFKNSENLDLVYMDPHFRHSTLQPGVPTDCAPHAHCTFPLLDLCSYPLPERDTTSLS